MVFIAFLLLPSDTLAKTEEFVKTIEKSFNIDKNGSLQIDNQFGKIDLISHDKNTVEISIKISVETSNEEKSKKKLDQIDVIINSYPTSVDMKTTFEKSRGNFNGNFSIDYTVKAPSSLNIDINNQFGDVFIDEWKGNAIIEVAYGNLTAGKLMAEDNDITLEFSKGSIGLINKGSVELAYTDRFNLDKAKELILRSSFSDYEIETVERLDCKSEYDEVEIRNVNRIELDASFSSVRIDNIHLEGDLSNEYGAIKVGRVSKGFESLDVENSFASIKIDFEEGAEFAFECEAEYGDVSVPSGADIRIDKKDHSEHYLKGTMGSGENLPSVNINVEYGSAQINID